LWIETETLTATDDYQKAAELKPGVEEAILELGN
jgi:hypothetical protein